MINKKSKNNILDSLDIHISSIQQENQTDKDTFTTQNSDCLKQLNTNKQDLNNKKQEKENLEQKPSEYEREVQQVQQLVLDRQDIIEKKKNIVNSLKTNRDFIFETYLNTYQEFNETEQFLVELGTQLNNLQASIKNNDVGASEDYTDDIKKILIANQNIQHPYVPLIEALQNFFDNTPDIDIVNRIIQITSNLLEDIQGSAVGFEELQETRSANFKDEIDRLEQELQVASNSLDQLVDYINYIKGKTNNIENDLDSLDNYMEQLDEQIMTQKAHCEGEQSRQQQREKERSYQIQIIQRIQEILESDYTEANNYISNLDLKLYKINYKY